MFEAHTNWRTPDKRRNHKGFYVGYKNKGAGQLPVKLKPSKGNKSEGKDNVLMQQAYKKCYKIERANHNRKAGAEWKRNKGMGALPK